MRIKRCEKILQKILQKFFMDEDKLNRLPPDVKKTIS